MKYNVVLVGKDGTFLCPECGSKRITDVSQTVLIKMIEGYYVKFYSNGECEPNYMIFAIDEANKTSQPYSVDPSTVCRYTGKVDKYATKIFEDSIIKESSYGHIGVVKFGEYEKGYGYYIEWISENAQFYREDLSYWIKKVTLVVVGNIFDNPELLKGAQDD